MKKMSIRIEKLRLELTNEYEKSIQKGHISKKVMKLSQKLDLLIVDYLKLANPQLSDHIIK
jgi:hypothetical protein